MSESIDLSGVFEGVRPVAENTIERLVTLLRVEEPIEEEKIPGRLLVTVNGDQVVRYQNLDRLPVEVKRIIDTLPGSMGFSKDILLKNINSLRLEVEMMKEEK